MRTLLGAVMVLVALAGAAVAQPAGCARGVQAAANAEVAYKPRGGRCEGLYLQPVAATAGIEIVGFHAHPPRFAAAQAAPIPVRVTAPDGVAEVNLKAVSTRHRHYYRMDARHPGKGEFLWPTELLRHPQILVEPGELAMLACLGACGGREPRLAPVSVGETGPGPRRPPILLVRAAVDLAELHVGLIRATDGAVLVEREMLAGRTVSAGVPFAIPLREVAGPGDYRLRLVAVPMNEAAIDEARAVLSLR
jgi:hypothetical protein